jgi:hypothetical protein
MNNNNNNNNNLNNAFDGCLSYLRKTIPAAVEGKRSKPSSQKLASGQLPYTT